MSKRDKSDASFFHEGGILAASTPFPNGSGCARETGVDGEERRSTFVVEKENNTTLFARKSARKQWNIPDQPVVFSAWTNLQDGKDHVSFADTISEKANKKSVTFAISNGDSVSSDSGVAVKNSVQIQNKKAPSNRSPLSRLNTTCVTAKTARRSLQSGPSVVKKQQRRSLENKKTTKSTTVCLPQRKLTLKKSTAQVQPRVKEPMPFACRNTLYDEHWSSKQERAFTRWLNYVLAPADNFGNTIPSSGRAVDDAGQLMFHKSEGHKVLSVSRLQLRRREACIRQQACQLYQSQKLEDVFLRLEIEVESRRLTVRLDRTIHSDIGLRERLIEVLNSYTAVWQRLGVEVLFGEILPSHSTNGRQLVDDYANYCVTRLCEDDAISQAYTCKTGSHGAGYEEALLQYAFRKLLMMVIFLDKAKASRLIDNDPCLFVKTSTIKSSRQVLVALSEIFLCGEGDVVKHLRLLNYTLSCVQRPLDEYDFSISNLAVDLRDGIRLCRLTEMLTNSWELSDQIRVPAASKTQKLHNVEVVLKELRQHVSFPHLVTAQAIVQGHKELTLSLLWSIIFHFKVNLQLDVEELRKEVEVLKQHKPHPIALANFSQRRCSLEPNIFFQSVSISMLLQWCNSVCTIYGVPVTNFTSSFSDGRVFCYLLHHYHPHLLPLEAINNDTSLTAVSQLAVEEDNDDVDDGLDNQWAKNFSPTTNKEKTLHIANEKANFKLLSEKMQLLGGVPPLVMSKDMVDTMPDEKVVIAYTSYLCRQLLSICHEVRAAIVLQKAWRNRLNRQERRMKMALREKAAVVIQAHLRRHLIQSKYQRIKQAAMMIQQHWRAHTMMLHQRTEFLLTQQAALVIQQWYRRQRCTRRERAAQLIQATFRGHLQFRQYSKLKQATCIIQLAYRRHLAVLKAVRARRHFAAVKIQSIWHRFVFHKNYLQLRNACLTIQQHYRAKILAEAARNSFTIKRSAAITIQAVYKSWVARRTFVMKRNAAIVLQRRFRALRLGRRVQENYRRTRQSVLLIQHAVRARLSLKHQAATKLQAIIRGYFQRCQYLEVRCSVLTVQNRYRAYKLAVHTRQHYRTLQQSCVVLQAAIRGWKGRREYKRMQSAAVTIQSWYKGMTERQCYVRMKQACSVIIQRWKAVQIGRVQRQKYLDTCSKLVKLQATIRGWRCRQWVELCHTSSTIIQRAYRAHLAWRNSAAVKIQTAYRGSRARKSFTQLRQAACTIQAHYRAVKEGNKMQQEFHQIRTSAVTLQASFRCYIARKNFLALKRAVLVAQTNWRRHKQQKEYTTTRRAALCVQRWYRWASHGKQVREDYLKMKMATVTIQRSFLAYKQRRQLMAAIKIQSVVRCVLARRSYLRTVNAVITIQAFTRGYLVRSCVRSLTAAVRSVEEHYKAKLISKEVQQDFQQTRAACITLQAAIRGWKRRQEYKRMQLAAVTIQSWYKGVTERQRYIRMKQACSTIAYHWRAVLLGRTQRQEFLDTYSKLVKLQAAIRGWRCRQWVGLCHTSAAIIQRAYRAYVARRYSAAVKIQAAYRSLCARKSFTQLRQAACTIQAHYRAVKEGRRFQQEFLQIRSSAVTIQTSFRCYIARNNFLALKRAVLVAQTNWRRHKQQKEYTATRQAALHVQRWYRWASHGRQVREDYLKIKWATVTVQRSFLVYKQRRQLMAAIKIQSVVRCVLARRSYLRIVNAVITIQAFTRGLLVRSRVRSLTSAVRIMEDHYKAKLMGRKMQQVYQQTRAACITLQTAIRSWKRRQEYKRMQLAAVTIQSWYKGMKERQRYIRMKQACITITYHWRAVQLGRMQRQEFLDTYSKLVKLQAAFRGWRCRQWVGLCHTSAAIIQQAYRAHLARRHSAAVKIQTAYRSFCAQKSFTQLRQAACTIKAHYRAVKEGRRLRQKLHQMHSSAVAIQAFFRCYIARKDFLALKRAVLVAQTNWRRHKQHKEYTATRQAALCVQRWYRWANHGKQVREDYLKIKIATVTIQRSFLAYKQRCQLMAAIKIQSVVRCVLARRSYLRIVNAAITIQAFTRGLLVRSYVRSLTAAVRIVEEHYKAIIVSRQTKETYQQLRAATISIQAAYKGWKVRSSISKLQTSVLTVERMWLGRQQRVSFLQQQNSALVIQKWFKSCLLTKEMHNKYIQIRSATLVLQTHTRGLLARKLCKNNLAARKIQSYYRGYKARNHFLRLKSATVVIQSFARMCANRRRYFALMEATLVIQSRARAWSCARVVQREYQKLRDATIALQAAYRCKKQRSIFLNLKNNATTIQAWYRMSVARGRYLNMRKATISLQTHFRSYLLGKTTNTEYQTLRKATIVIQSHFKGHQQRNHYLQLRQASIKIQSIFHMYQCRREYNSKKYAAVILQKYTRACLLGKKVRGHYVNMRAAAVLIQSIYCRYRVEKRNSAAVKIQSHVRRYLTQSKYTGLKSAAISVQKHWRGLRCLQQYQRIRNAVLCLQQCYHAHALRVQLHEEQVKRDRSATIIQTAYRAHVCHMHYSKVRWAATVLQSHVRRFLAEREFVNIRNSVICIQQKWRATLLARTVQAEFHSKQMAARTIQQWYSGCVHARQTRCWFLQVCTASVTLQRAIRKYLHHKQQQRELAAKCIQRAFRHHIELTKRKKRAEHVENFACFAMLSMSVIRIQRAWRSYQEHLRQQRRHFAAIKIQTWIRMIIVRRRYHKLLLSVTTVQHICREHIHQIRQRKLHRCATRIQACWKGFIVRRQTSVQICNMRERLRRANSVERHRVTLRDQMPALLELLMRGRYLSHGTYVLEKLELITRLSDTCSLVLVETGALPALCAVLDGSNRNRASLVLVKIALQILLNLTRWLCTSADVMRNEGVVPTIIGLMKKICVTQPDIMQLSCHLLSVFSKQQTELVRKHLSPEIRQLTNMAANLKKKLLVLNKQGQVPCVQQQKQQFQSSLCLLEQTLLTLAVP